MFYIKLVLISLIVSVCACGGDKSLSENSGNSSSEIVNDKITVSVELIANGKNWAGIEGCLGKIVYSNGMDTKAKVHIIRYEVKHSSDSGYKIGLATKRTIKVNKTSKIDASFSGLNCDEVTGLEIQAFTCETEAGIDCAENFNFVSTSDVALTVKKQN
jgi:hypothetical protein